MGDYLYNFWRDKAHPRGIWRRTTLAEYRKAQPKWETLSTSTRWTRPRASDWVCKGAECLKPEYSAACSRCRRRRRRGGVREFDIPRQVLRQGRLRAARWRRPRSSWIDEDTIYVGTDFGPGSMTESSYPRIVKEWKRGTPLTAAKTVYEGKPHRPRGLRLARSHAGFRARFRHRVAKDFFHSEHATCAQDGKLIARRRARPMRSADAHREWLLVQTRSPWTIGGTTYPSGTLLATQLRRLHGRQARLHRAVHSPTRTPRSRLFVDAASPDSQHAGRRQEPARSADAAATAGDWKREAAARRAGAEHDRRGRYRPRPQRRILARLSPAF